MSPSQEFHACFFTLQLVEVTVIKSGMDGGIPMSKDGLHVLTQNYIQNRLYIIIYRKSLGEKNHPICHIAIGLGSIQVSK